MRKLYIIFFIFLFTFAFHSLTTSSLPTVEAQGPPDTALQRITTARERAEEKRHDSVEEFEAKQNEARERAEEKRQEAQERLQTIRDEQRQRLAERLMTNLDRMNQNWVTHWTRVLDNMSHVLAKMETRADKLEEVGHDVADTRDMIAAADMAIADAQESLNEQAGKVYEVEFTDDDNLGSAIQSAIAELRADLFAVKTEVQEAMKATRDALTSLKSSAESEVDEPELDEDENDEDEEDEDNDENGESEE
jgi:hypothetical protein